MKQRTEAQKGRDQRRDEATELVAAAHPGFQELLYSWFGMDLTVDVKDKDGAWWRYAHHTDDPTAAIVLGSV